MKYKNAESKLKHAMQLFEEAVDHTVDAHYESHRASRFYHNTECEGQWEAEDLEYLRANYRPTLSFNIIKPKIDTFLGMYADAQRTPIVTGTGEEDELLAKAINHVKDQMLQDAKYEPKAARMLKNGTVEGEAAIQVEIAPSNEGSGWIKLMLHRIQAYELHWDIASLEPDRSDARYVFWDRWLSKEEFDYAYPGHEGQWETLVNNSTPYEGDEIEAWQAAETIDGGWTERNDYQDEKWNRYYYDRQKNKVRVIRYEYLTYRDRYHVTNTQTGDTQEVDADQFEMAKTAINMGAPMEVTTSREEVVEVCEFVGRLLLAEYDEAGPFDGFSIVDYCYDIDDETGTAYGPIRNLFDPQAELNKSISLDIEYLAQSTAPGAIAEEGAVPDEDAFADAMRTPGAVAKVSKNALTSGSVQERQPTQPSVAVANRRMQAMELLSEISGMPSAANLTAAEHQQAGVTVALRYHKQKQTVSSPFANFEESQKNIVQRVVQAIANAMPDDQFESVLASEGDFLVGNGMLVELGPAPEGMGGGPQQLVPVAQAELRSRTEMKWSLDMEFASENSTIRMLELDLMLQLTSAGVAVDPEVMVERATGSKSVRERLKSHVERAAQAAAEGQRAQSEALQQQAQQFAMVEMGKVQESQRHNMATEQIDATNNEQKALIEVLKTWEKADEAEKARILEMARFAEEMQLRKTGGSADVR